MKKRFFFLTIISLIALCFSLPAVFSANLTPVGAKYEFFSRINAVLKSGDNLFLADKNAVYMFDADFSQKSSVVLEEANTEETVKNPSGFAVFDNILFVLDNERIKLFNINDNLKYMGFIDSGYESATMAISIDKDYPTSRASLYLADNTNAKSNIDIYSLETGSIATGGNQIDLGGRYLNYDKITPSISTEINMIDNIVPYYISDSEYGIIYFGKHPASERPLAVELTLPAKTAKTIDITYSNSAYINDAVFSPDTKELFCAANDGIFAFTLTGDKNDRYRVSREYKADKSVGVLSGRLGTASNITYDNGVVYVSDADTKSIQSFNSATLKFDRNIFCGASSDAGYFNNPSSVSASGGIVYVADTTNDRVQLVGKDGTSFVDFDFTAPTEVAANIEGGIYVVDRTFSRLTHFNPLRRLVYESPWRDAYISDIALSLDNTLYVSDLKSRIIYTRGADDGSFQPLLDLSADFIPKRIAHSPNKKILYILSTENLLYSYSAGIDTAPQLLHTFTRQINDIAADYGGNIIAITNSNELYMLSNGTETLKPLDYSGRNEVLIDAVSLHIATEDDDNNGAIYSYGDLFICDKGKSAIKRVPKELTGIFTVDTDDYRHEVDYVTADSFTIKKVSAVSHAPLYSYPFNSKRIASIKAGDSVIILKSDLTDNDYFSEALYQNAAGTTLSPVYVLKSQLSESQESAPLYTDGRTLHEKNTIYKYPLTNSPALKNGDEDINLGKARIIRLLDFSEDYKDSKTAQFYKVQFQINGTNFTGYINVVNVVSKYYAPVTVLPKLNATVKTKNITGAPLYEYIDGAYVAVTDYAPLKNGNKVHIIGNFDSSSDFTEIYLIDGEEHVLRFFIETANLAADGLSLIQVIAIILIILIVLVGLIMLITKRRAFVLRNRESN